MSLKNPLFHSKALADIGVYFFSTAINQAVPFLLLPVFTLYLLPGDYGFINNFQALLTIETSLFAGLTWSLSKGYFSRDAGSLRLLVGNLYAVLLAGILLVFILSGLLAAFTRLDWIPTPYFFLTAASAFFYMSLEFLKTFFKASRRALAYTALSFFEVAINVSLSLLLIIGLSWSWRGRVAAIAVSTALLGLFAAHFFVTRQGAVFSLNAPMIREILSVCLPLIPSGLSVMLIRKSGVLFIDAAFGKREAGLYGVALNLATLILFLSVPLINVWTPFLLKTLSGKSGKETLSSLYHKMVLFALAILLGATIFSLLSRPLLGLMTTTAFQPAHIYLSWLAFGFGFWAVALLLTPFFIHFQKQKIVGAVWAMAALLNAGLTLLLMKASGAKGVAIAFLCANLFSALCMYAAGRRYCCFPLRPSFSSLRRELHGVLKP